MSARLVPLRSLLRPVRSNPASPPLSLDRASSHGHRTHAWKREEGANAEWVNECDPPPTWKANRDAVLAEAWRARDADQRARAEARARAREERNAWLCLVGFLAGLSTAQATARAQEARG